jgi:hypothetical protein
MCRHLTLLLRCCCLLPAVQVMVTPDGSSAVRVPGSSNVIEVLRSLGNYQTFVLALQVRAAGCIQHVP